mgnify:CR=1 FL=1
MVWVLFRSDVLRQLRKGLNTRLRAKLVLKGAQLGYCLVFGARDIRLAPAARPTTIAAVSYTQLTLPTIKIEMSSVVAAA